MKEIYRWEDKGDTHEYRFTDGVCDGFFSNGKESFVEKRYKGRPMTEVWAENLPKAGFVLVSERV